MSECFFFFFFFLGGGGGGGGGGEVVSWNTESCTSLALPKQQSLAAIVFHWTLFLEFN